MSEQLTKYHANIGKAIEEIKTKKIFIKEGSDKIEKHHIQGRLNSDSEIPLCKPCHDFVTIGQNSLSVDERKNKELMALKSVIGLFELACQHLREIMQVKIEEEHDKQDSN
ncbi:MAG TPA: hypothetical protein VJH65_00400 [Candidatus Nanoarchaeia archaeon]|nr:hypothetical protein [Candidatus Nanoarchaeia archaeon]